MTRFNLRSAAALALGMAVLAAPTAGSAQRPFVVTGSALPTEIVSYRDLNLASGDGVARLNRRIESAANRLCVDPNPQPLSAVMLDRACRADAIASAAPQVSAAIANFGKTEFASASMIRVARR